MPIHINNQLSINTESQSLCEKQPLKTLAIINTTSGSGKAWKHFQSIRPIWDKCGVVYDMFKTRYAGHLTKRLASDKHITRYDKVVVFGGDGTFAEAVKGLEDNPWTDQIFNKICLGIIPSGSGNGLSRSLHFAVNRPYSVKEAAKMAAQSAFRHLDLIEVVQQGRKLTGFLAVNMGLIADIDILSEPLRFLGDIRYTIEAIKSIWRNKAYNARLTYLPEDEEEVHRTDKDQAQSTNLKTLSGRFSLIMIGNTSHCSATAHTAPGAQMDDGYMYVAVMKEVSRWTLLKVLLKLDSGRWTEEAGVKCFKTKFIKLEPLSHDIILTLDGERMPIEPIECRTRQAALRVLCG